MGEASIIVGELDAEASPTSAETHTVRLEESHTIGADGRPERHKTVQTIEAVVDGISSHRVVFDLAEARVESIHNATPGDPYRIKASYWAVDLTLPRTLNQAEQHTIEVLTTFRGDGPIEPMFRRATHRRIENATIRVSFHPDALPSQVWWAQWRDYREPNDYVISREPVALDAENTVEQHVSVLERAVAGFLWSFE
jgi:hypothetical protein